MHRYGLILCCCFILLLGKTTAVNAQWANQEVLTQKMYLHNKAYPSTRLFVHFDKTIYTNNETVWFTGYIFNTSLNDINKHQVLSVALIRDIDSTIIKQDKYLINDGLSFGAMLLPDSMLTGNYHFQASTNRINNGVPEVLFIQPVIIKTNIDPAFNASITLLKEGIAGKNPNELVLTVTTRDARFLPKPVEVNYRYGNISKKTKTNASGELVLSLPEQENITDPNVYAKLKYGKDSSFLNLALPVSHKKAAVRFYPEGGHLIDRVPATVGWEVKDKQQAMVTLKALLYENDKVIDTLETNSYGVGKFVLIPKKSSVYKVKLMHSAFADSTYYLPQVLKTGVTLTVLQAVANDTLLLRVINNSPQKLAMRIHDFRKTYAAKELDLTSSYHSIKIPLTDIPKGLKTVTLFDTLGRPLCERMFFAHYDSKGGVNISTDKPTYSQRQKVTLTLKLNDADTVGLVSVACVQDNRLPLKLTTDIESYAYLNSEMSALPLSPSGRGFDNKAYLEDMLLIKGWSKYTWQELMNTSIEDTVKNYDSLAVKLKVTRFNKPLKKPVELGYLRDLNMGFMASDSSGELTLKNSDMLVKAGGVMRVFVNGKNQLDYSIKVTDPYPALNKTYIRSFPYQFASVPSTVQNNTVLSLKANEKVIRLKEVQISSGGNGINYRRGANACGDYVCRFNILNCLNHPSDYGNTQPVPGRVYTDGRTGGKIVYKDCKDKDQDLFITKINAIYTRREFYVNDYHEPLEPAFVSTLYWNHAVILHSKEEQMTFYTGDITGKFRIVVQGITDTDVLFGQQFFEVKGK